MSNALICDYCSKTFSGNVRRFVVTEKLREEYKYVRDMCYDCHEKAGKT